MPQQWLSCPHCQALSGFDEHDDPAQALCGSCGGSLSASAAGVPIVAGGETPAGAKSQETVEDIKNAVTPPFIQEARAANDPQLGVSREDAPGAAGIVERFADAWRSGRRPVLEHYLSAQSTMPQTVLRDLVRIDLENRVQAGESARVENYFEHYPGLADDREAALELIVREYQLRKERDNDLAAGEYQRRFPRYRAEIGARLGTPVQEKVATRPTLVPAEAPAAPPTRLPQIPGYEVLSVLGRGGMGVVYKARHIQLKRLVALKMILSGSHVSPQELARFRIEAEAVARLQHPNIVQIYEIGTHEDRPYFSLEYVDGGSLGQKLRGTPRPARESANLVETLARAMHVAHERGIVHRDLKPANVLLSDPHPPTPSPAAAGEGESCAPLPRRGSAAGAGAGDEGFGIPKIADFGLAKQLGEEVGQTHSGAIMGTPSYMAPEQAAGRVRDIGPAADVYALGSILYELLVGRPPFQAASVLDTLEQVCRQEPVPPSRLQPKLPRDLETICLKCLEKEPVKRYVSALALAEDLRRFQNDEPIQARSIGAAERLWRWARRNPVVAGLGATAALLLVLVAGVATVGYVQTALALNKEAAARQEADLQRQDARAAQLRAEEKEEAAKRQKEIATRQKEESLRRLYVSDVNLAQRAWQEAQVPLALELLWGQRPSRIHGRPELRDFEWFYLWRLCQGQRLAFLGHAGPVTCLAFSPDGTRVASAQNGQYQSEPSEVKIWDANTGQEAIGLRTASWRTIQSLSFSPDGRKLAVAYGELPWLSFARAEVKIWDARTGKEILTCREEQARAVEVVAFSPAGDRLATVSGAGKVTVWDAATGQALLPFPAVIDRVRSIAYSPDGEALALAGDQLDKDGRSRQGAVQVRDAAGARLVAAFSGHARSASGVFFSPDGKRVASIGQDSGARAEVKVWDVKSGQEELAFHGQGDAIHALAFSPDGRRLASGGADRTVKIWDAATGHVLFTLRGHAGGVLGVAFHRDGKRLASAGADHAVKIWDVADPETRTLCKHSAGKIIGAALSPDGKYLATGCSDQTVKVWNARTGAEVRSFPGYKYIADRTSFSQDGRSHPWTGNLGEQSLAFSPDGKLLAVAGLSGSVEPGSNKEVVKSPVKVWDVEAGRELLTLPGHEHEITSVAFSPDGRRLVTGASSDHDKYGGNVKFWDVATGKELFALGGDAGIECLAFSPDGRCLAAASWRHHTNGGNQVKSIVKIWDATSGQELLTFYGHALNVSRLVFSPDGRSIASSAGREDGEARAELFLWDAATGKILSALRGHSLKISSLAFSPNGRRLVSASRDMSVRLWDTATGQLILSCALPSPEAGAVAFSPDGKHLVATVNNEVKIWDATTLEDGPVTEVLAGAETPATPEAKMKTLAELTRAGLPILKKIQSDPRLLNDPIVRVKIEALEREMAPLLQELAGPEAEAEAGGKTRAGFRLTIAAARTYAPDIVQDLEELERRRAVKDAPGKFSAEEGKYEKEEQKRLAETFKLMDSIKNIEELTKPIKIDPPLFPPVNVAPPNHPPNVKPADKPLDVVKQQRLAGHAGPILAVAYSRDGSLLLTGSSDQTLRVWDVRLGQEQQRLQGHAGGVNGVALTRDGLRALSGSDDKTLRLWDMKTGETIRRFTGHTHWVRSVALSPDGRRALSGSSDRTLRLWDLDTGRELLRCAGHEGGIWSVAFAPDGRHALSASTDKTVRLWDLDKGAELKRFEGHAGAVRAVAVSPDGRFALSGSEDKSVRLWNLETGALVRSFPGHAHWVTSVAFSPDGRQALAGGFDGSLLLWDVESGKELWGAKTDAPILGVAFSPDGQAIVGAGNDKEIRMWWLGK